ncbi:hypothetical protein B0T18DRAFT_425777 [Schizothecium vesticola]|uniref:Uncharacterized protein n=1 Tax=Schizothecium vesticola TaxID=314040 RepID=A0AA40F4K4_9PEZI|nr:hypothetical protein B0T18DRAFT_425777 [Schizothecium vesticola]
MVTLPTPPRNPYPSNDNADMDSDSESTTSTSTTSTFLTSTSTSTPSPARTPTPTTTPHPLSSTTPPPPPPLFWNHPLPTLTRHAIPTPGNIYLLLHVASQRALSLLHGAPTLVSPPLSHPSPGQSPQAQAQAQTLGCHHWTLTTSRGYLGLRSCASATFLGRDLPGRVVAEARGHGSWEAFVAVPAASAGCVDYDGGGDGYYVLMCINFVAGCLERIGVRRGDGEGGDGLGVLLEGVEEGAVWEFVGVGGGG